MAKQVVCHQCKAVFKDEAACKMHGGAKGHRWQAPATSGRSVVVATGAPAQSSSANRESKGSFVCAVCMLEFADEEAYRKASRPFHVVAMLASLISISAHVFVEHMRTVQRALCIKPGGTLPALFATSEVRALHPRLQYCPGLQRSEFQLYIGRLSRAPSLNRQPAST